MRFIAALLLGTVAAAIVILLLGQLATVSPGNPVFAVLLAIGILAAGVFTLRGLGRMRRPTRPETPEDVGDLDVLFVCGECGTEFRVERLGELQVPRHCGEKMRVERRPRGRGLNPN